MGYQSPCRAKCWASNRAPESTGIPARTQTNLGGCPHSVPVLGYTLWNRSSKEAYGEKQETGFPCLEEKVVTNGELEKLVCALILVEEIDR